MNCLKNMERFNFTQDMIMSMISLYKFNGKDHYYNETFKTDIEYMKKDTIEHETYNLYKILGLPITEARAKVLIRKHNKPKTKDEMLLKNISKKLKTILDGGQNMQVEANTVLDLGKGLFKGIKEINFATHEVQVQNNLLVETKNISKREKLDELIETFLKLEKSGQYEELALIVSFYVDFMCIAPLKSENELVGLIFLYSLLCRYGFSAFKYTSFFESFIKYKDNFERALNNAKFGWEEGFSQTAPLYRTLIDIILNSYRLTDSLLNDYQYDQSLNKTDSIENTIYKLKDVFSKEEIRAKHPYTSEATINRTLKRLKEEGKIEPMGTGRSAKWVRLEGKSKFKLYEQLSIFEETD